MSDSRPDTTSGRTDRPEDDPVPQPGGTAGDSGLLQFALNAVMLAGFGFLFWQAGMLPESRWEPLGAGAFPRVVLGVLMLLNLITLIQSAPRAYAELGYGPARLAGVAWRTMVEFRTVFTVLAAFGVFLLLIRPLGFMIAAFLFAFGVQMLLGPRTVRNLVISAIIAAVVAAGLQIFFAQVLYVFLPRGPLL